MNREHDREWGVWKGIIHSGLRGLLARGKCGIVTNVLLLGSSMQHTLNTIIRKNIRSKYTGN